MNDLMKKSLKFGARNCYISHFYLEGDTCETGFRTAASKLVLVEPFGADYGEIFELKNYFIGAGVFQNYDYVKCEMGDQL